VTRLVPKILALLVLCAFFASSSAAQSVSPEAVADDFVKAWNSHDVKAFDRLFTDDAIWIAVAESRIEGRTNIIKDFAEIHSTWAKTTTVAASAKEARTLKLDVAVVLFHLRYLDKQGNLVPNIDRAMILVTVKQTNGWRIAVGQITKESPKR